MKFRIDGVPGNDLGVFMNGPEIEVFGNAEDHTGNTMESGRIIIHGNAWDVTGLAARGGEIFVRGNGGYRIGIHMKEYGDQHPTIIYGGQVRQFFGEYMAGGILIALGMRITDEGYSEDIPAKDVVGQTFEGTGSIEKDQRKDYSDKADPVREHDCIWCMACVSVCPPQAIKVDQSNQEHHDKAE